MAQNKKPQIRFKGFADDWEQRKLGKVLVYLQNNTLSRAELSTDQGVYENIHYGDILVIYGSVLDVSKEKLPTIIDGSIVMKYKSSFLQNGDIIIADTAEDETVGKCTEINGLKNQVVLSGLHTIPYRPLFKFASGYLGYYMNSNAYHDQLLPLMQGIKVTSISKSAMQNTNIIYPKSLDEQNKIGECFNNLDRLITLNQCKIDKLVNIKKTLLEKMFPKDNDKVPEMRFKGFTDDWGERKLDDFGKATGGISIESEFSEDGTYKVISIGSYSETSRYNDQGIRCKLSNRTKDRILNKDNITMILNDKTSSGNIIGRVLLIEKSGLYVYNQRTERIEINKEKYDPLFIYQLLNAPNIRQKIIKESQGNTQIYVNWTRIKELTYNVPNIEEQRKIGKYFNNIDKLIKLHQYKLEKIKKIKKSLQRKMFV